MKRGIKIWRFRRRVLHDNKMAFSLGGCRQKSDGMLKTREVSQITSTRNTGRFYHKHMYLFLSTFFFDGGRGELVPPFGAVKLVPGKKTHVFEKYLGGTPGASRQART